MRKLHLQESPQSLNTMSRKLFPHKLHKAGKTAIRKPLRSKTNNIKCLEWSKTLRNWFLEQWKKVLFSDASFIALFPTSGRLYVCRNPKDDFVLAGLFRTVKHIRWLYNNLGIYILEILQPNVFPSW